MLNLADILTVKTILNNLQDAFGGAGIAVRNPAYDCLIDTY